MKSLKSVWKGKIYGDEPLIKTAPKSKGELEFFKLEKYISPQELQDEYDKRGLTPAHPLILAEWVEKNIEEEGRYATQWSRDGWCCATFDRWYDGRGVGVDRDGSGWGDGWSFAGVRKPSALEPSEKSLETLTLEARIEKLEEFEEKVRKFLII